MITGLCCDYAIQNAVSDRDDAIRAQIRDKENWKEQFKSMFRSIDDDNSGEITDHELREILQDEEFQAYLAHLNVSVDDALDMLDIFDKDGDGTVSIDEFVMGCMRVKGQAKTMDIMRVRNDIEVVREKVELMADNLDKIQVLVTDSDVNRTQL